MEGQPTVFPPSKLGEYTVVEEIAQGTFGVVKKAIHTVTGHTVAMKYISKVESARDRSRVKKEYQYLKLLKHPHIIKLYEVINTQADYIFVLEYAGGELFNYISMNGRMPEPRARRFFQQLISGIDYIHRLKIVHRDLKPENVLLDDDLNVKIADFGLSSDFSDGNFLSTSCGSPNYASPEVINGGVYAGPEIDVWSAGVMLYVMLCGCLPFEDDDMQILFQKIRSGSYAMPPFVSTEARKLIGAMLTLDTIKRITKPFPVLGTLSSLVSPPIHPLDFEIIPEFGRVEEDVVDALVSRLAGVTKEDIMACLRREDGVNGNVVKVAYMLLRDQRRVGKDLSYFAEQERDALLAALDVCFAAHDFAILSDFQNSLEMSYHPMHYRPGGGDLEANPFETNFADGAEDLEDSDEADTTDSYPEVNNFAVLNSSLPEQHHLSSYVTARRSAGSSSSVGKRRRQGDHKSKWHFGIRSRSPPMEILLEIYKTLKTLGMEWLEKKSLGGLGGVNTRVTRGANGVAKIEREKRLDGAGEVDLREACGVYYIETRTRVQNVVVLMNIQLYWIDATNYLVDFHHKKSYKASTQPGAGKFDMAVPRSPQAESEKDAAIKEAEVVSPYVFMDVACRLILELAGGGE
ncbi:Pkinase-domain-containing protein [Gymnopus androsaceus JB14]|uniref:non-specific serine/threonine protein kinase n=1 Tax=Gymnopus androsaceus JB14 TaxID=1447944 RepID=A0A6A4HNV1_9AGAR|nr:Pkinase-domain-containing protein [Gymnopus androsaceus JB14]